MEILTKLLYPRGPIKGGQIVTYYEVSYTGTNLALIHQATPLQSCDISLENLLETSQSEPFIAVLGKVGEVGTQYFICAEKDLIIQAKTLKDALLDLICSYYIFNISYPKTISAVFIFFQHIVCNLKDAQVHPKCLCKLLQNIGC